MTEAEWLAFDDPKQLRSALFLRASARKLRLLVAACIRDCSAQLTVTVGAEVIGLNEEWADRPFSEARWHEASHRFRRSNNLETESVARGFYPGLKSDAGWAAASVVWAVGGLLASAAMPAGWTPAWGEMYRESRDRAWARSYQFFRDICNAPNPVSLDPAWLTSDVVALARGIYDERAFDRMPILADALQDAGCTSDDILSHCRDTNQPHVRGCWVVDLVLGKE